jgi:hypothetical protein
MDEKKARNISLTIIGIEVLAGYIYLLFETRAEMTSVITGGGIFYGVDSFEIIIFALFGGIIIGSSFSQKLYFFLMTFEFLIILLLNSDKLPIASGLWLYLLITLALLPHLIYVILLLWKKNKTQNVQMDEEL